MTPEEFQYAEVTDEMVGRAWALYCEALIHDDFGVEQMRGILKDFLKSIKRQLHGD